jgi:TP901 family phage tail tape measure protein
VAIGGTIDILLRGDLAGFENALSRAETRLDRFGSRMTSIGTRLSLGLSTALFASGAVALNSAVDFEQAVAGMAKTIDASEQTIERYAGGFTKLSQQIPVARTELAGIAEEAGQLGVAVKGIPGFTRVVADLRVATNLGEEAGTSLARMANIMGDANPEFERMASTIVDLGNNGASTEREIAAMALRIAGAGKIIGLHHPEVLALANGLSSLGIEAEAGGTAVSRVMVEIANAVASGGDKLNRFAQIAGMSSAEFTAAFREDAAGAVISFTEGLGRLNDAGANVFAVLEDVEFQNVRVRDALLRAAGGGDLMRRSLDLSRQAWTQNNALTKEAERFYATTAGQLKILRNRISNIAGELGKNLAASLLAVLAAGEPLLQFFERSIQVFGELPPVLQQSIIAVTALLAVLGPLGIVLGSSAQVLSVFAGSAGHVTRGLLALGKAAKVVLDINSLASAGALARTSFTLLARLMTPTGMLVAGLTAVAALFLRARFRAAEAAAAARQAATDFQSAAENMPLLEVRAELNTKRHALADRNRTVERMEARVEELRRKVRFGAATRISLEDAERRLEPYKAEQKVLEEQVRVLEERNRLLLNPPRPDEIPIPAAPPELSKEAEERAKRIADAHTILATELRSAAGMEALLGEEFDENAAKAGAYQAALQALLDEGVSPTDARVRELAAGLMDATDAVEAAREATKRAADVERERNQLQQEALGLYERSLTPLEVYRTQVETLRQALDQGLITQEQYNRAVGELDAELKESTNSLVDTLREQGERAGESLIRGILSGARNMEDLLKSFLIDLAATTIMGAIKGKLGIASPSKVFYGYGQSIGQGLVLGMRSTEAMISAASNRMAEAALLPALREPMPLAVGAGAAGAQGAGRFDIDPSRLPRPLTPFEAQRDNLWMELFSGSVQEFRSRGGRLD